MFKNHVSANKITVKSQLRVFGMNSTNDYNKDVFK